VLGSSCLIEHSESDHEYVGRILLYWKELAEENIQIATAFRFPSLMKRHVFFSKRFDDPDQETGKIRKLCVFRLLI